MKDEVENKAEEGAGVFKQLVRAGLCHEMTSDQTWVSREPGHTRKNMDEQARGHEAEAQLEGQKHTK